MKNKRTKMVSYSMLAAILTSVFTLTTSANFNGLTLKERQVVELLFTKYKSQSILTDRDMILLNNLQKNIDKKL
jgi:hypothetical protein